MKTLKIWVINGPNLKYLERRDPALYGGESWQEIERKIREKINPLSVDMEILFLDKEGDIIEKIHQISAEAKILEKEKNQKTGIILNPGAYSHTSLAILDCLMMSEVPVIEVHLSNLYQREDRRKVSVTGEGALGVIMGLGWKVYWLAVEALREELIYED
ncbi:MAG: 3-dehydroquinate dehydratase [Planctomycetota bacterium]|nr:MAG: 3-dehydroquinate dehydratase [Planctomycetota bacterium]